MRALATTRHRIYLLTVKRGQDRDVVLKLRARGVKAYAPAFLDDSFNDEFLFPGYVFVWCYSEWDVITFTPGVLEFIRFGETLATVRASVIKKLKQRESPTGFVQFDYKEPERLFADGSVVRYGTNGPHVTVARYEDLAQRRVRILMQLLGGRAAEMTVSERDLVAA